MLKENERKQKALLAVLCFAVRELRRSGNATLTLEQAEGALRATANVFCSGLGQERIERAFASATVSASLVPRFPEETAHKDQIQ